MRIVFNIAAAGMLAVVLLGACGGGGSIPEPLPTSPPAGTFPGDRAALHDRRRCRSVCAR